MSICFVFFEKLTFVCWIDILLCLRLLENLNNSNKEERDKESVIMNLKLLIKLREREIKYH